MNIIERNTCMFPPDPSNVIERGGGGCWCLFMFTLLLLLGLYDGRNVTKTTQKRNPTNPTQTQRKKTNPTQKHKNIDSTQKNTNSFFVLFIYFCVVFLLLRWVYFLVLRLFFFVQGFCFVLCLSCFGHRMLDYCLTYSRDMLISNRTGSVRSSDPL